jgi:hypothetical protein
MTDADGFILDPPPQDATNIVPGMAIHGAEGMDVVVIDFAARRTWRSFFGRAIVYAWSAGSATASYPPHSPIIVIVVARRREFPCMCTTRIGLKEN